MADLHKRTTTRLSSLPIKAEIPNQFPKLSINITILHSCIMVNRKLSHVPLSSAGRIDTMTRVICTCSYQAMMASGVGPSLLRSSASTLRLSPDTSPGKAPSVALKPPSINFVNCTSDAPANSQSSSASSLNPHVNPFILSTLGALSNSISASTFTVCNSLTTSAQLTQCSPKKRTSTDAHIIEDDDDDDLPLDMFDEPRFKKVAKHVEDEETGQEDMPAPHSSAAQAEQEQTFQVSFNLWNPLVPDEPEPAKRKKTTSSSRPKSKQPLKSPVPKYQNHNLKVPSKLTIISPTSISFVVSKHCLFEACDKKNPWVAVSLTKQRFKSTIDIQGYINLTRQHKAKKMLIDDQNSLEEFMNYTQLAPASTPMGFKIHYENPKVTSNTSRMMAEVHKADDPVGSSERDPLSEGSVGSIILSDGARKHNIWMARFEKYFKAGENITFVLNPKDPGQCMLLNHARIHTWANNWADGVRDVDDVTPPTTRPGFTSINVANYQKQKELFIGLTPPKPAENPAPVIGTVVHHNYYGQPFGSSGFPNPTPAFPNGGPPPSAVATAAS